MNYIFDVDGTLTDKRKPINERFAKEFEAFCQKNSVFIVSGSDYAKLKEQLTNIILLSAKKVFTCMGNSVWENGVETYVNDWTPTEAFIEKLNSYLKKSTYEHRYGNHIEKRTGMINISVVGRAANSEQRKAYFYWDNMVNERESIKRDLEKNFGDMINVSIGGEISIDIVPTGHDKSQILKYISTPITYVGDSVGDYGNDHSIIQALLNCNGFVQIIKTTCWQETEDFINTYKY